MRYDRSWPRAARRLMIVHDPKATLTSSCFPATIFLACDDYHPVHKVSESPCVRAGSASGLQCCRDAAYFVRCVLARQRCSWH